MELQRWDPAQEVGMLGNFTMGQGKLINIGCNVAFILATGQWPVESVVRGLKVQLENLLLKFYVLRQCRHSCCRVVKFKGFLILGRSGVSLSL